MKFINEFKEFAIKGNVVDLAIGVIIGAAFQSIIRSLVDDIISPLIGLISDMNFDTLTLNIGNVIVFYGKFFTAVINFLIMALTIFLIIKFINKITRKKLDIFQKPELKRCPYCITEISKYAERCPNCTSVLDDENKEITF